MENRPAIASRPRRPGRLSPYAPWPLVGISLILAALILLTPVLFSNSHQPVPGLLTQAELVVDKISANDTMHFYVWALGETIRYTSIVVGVATAFTWTGNTSLAFDRLNWTEWYNGTNVLSVNFASTANPVAVNITAHYYVSSSASAWYIGMLAFYVSPGSPETLYSTANTPGVTVQSPIAVSNSTLPIPILLKNAGSGGTP